MMSTGNSLRMGAVLMTIIIQGHSICPPAEEGHEYKLTCSVGNRMMSWSFDGNQVLDCDDNGCRPQFPDAFSGSITQKDGKYESQLIIARIARLHKTKWICSYTSSAATQPPVIVCDPLGVYAKPVNITCDQPVLVNSNMDVNVTCRTDKVYPQAGCQYYKGTNKVTGLVDITNTSFSQNGNVYYRSQCTLTVPIKDLGQGSHSFIVKIYPDVTGGHSYGVDSKETQAIQLSLPTAALDPGCVNGSNVKDGYIKKGETVRCKCKTSSTGNPPGTVKWKDGSGTDVLTIDNANSDQSHTCIGFSVLGLESPGVNYSPKIAYGPDSVTFGTTNNSIYDLCTGDNLQIPGNCQVVKDQVNPAPSLTVTSRDGEIIEETRQIDPVYQFSYTFKPRRSGHLKVKCLATNTKFKDFWADGHLYMEVRAPPTSSPIIRVNNVEYSCISGNTVDVTNGDVISCHVEGGHPPAKVTLSCDSDERRTSSGMGYTQLTLDNGKTEGKMNCTCIGSHDVVLKCPYREMAVMTPLVYKERTKDSSSSGETAIVGGVLGCLLIIVSGAFIFFVLKTKGKFNNCSKGCTGNEKQKQFTDRLAQGENPDSQMSMSQHRNEGTDFDGYEVPVTPHLYENSPIADNTDSVNTEPGRIGKGNTAYENTV